MAHARKTIRAAFRARLLGGTRAADRVFTSRLAPITPEMLDEDGPALLVYVRDEHITWDRYPTAGTGAVYRDLEVTIEGVVRGAQSVDDDLDDLAAEVEACLEDWEVPGYPSAEVRLLETELDISDVFEFPVGSVSMTYRLRYWTEYRPCSDDSKIPDDVFAFIQGGPVREILIDGPGNDDA